MKFSKIGRVLLYLWFVMFVSNVGLLAAQSVNFSETGQIRPIVSETDSDIPPWKDSAVDLKMNFSGVAKSKTDFYFAYKTVENGKVAEKWVALADEKSWRRYSHQTVRISGSLRNNKLSNISMTPLTEMSEEYLLNPPPTVGLYKTVAVPLTIQPTNLKNLSPTNVTPEAIRQNLFNAPNAVNKFYLEASDGKFGFTGVHHPQVDVVPVTIQATISQNCQEQIITQFTPIVQQRLREQNIETTDGSVDLGLIIFNDIAGCPPYPFASRGALGQRGVPAWVWMPESWFVTGPMILAHEIGHAIGGNHIYQVRCTNFDDTQTCTVNDAADRDFMTSGGRFYMLPNNYERRRWGWHPPGAFDNPSIGIVDYFDLQSPGLPFGKESAKRGRFLYRNMSGVHTNWQIFPEARRNWGQFDNFQPSDDAFRRGVTLRYGHRFYGDTEAVTYIIDPNSTPELDDAPLLQNQQFSIGGVFIQCLGEYNPNRGTRIKIQ